MPLLKKVCYIESYTGYKGSRDRNPMRTSTTCLVVRQRTAKCTSVYRFIGVWQQESSQRPQRENGMAVHMSSLIPHAPSLWGIAGTARPIWLPSPSFNPIYCCAYTAVLCEFPNRPYSNAAYDPYPGADRTREVTEGVPGRLEALVVGELAKQGCLG